MKKEHASDLSHLRKQASQPMQEDNMTGRCSRKRLWTDTSVMQAENATRKQANWAPRMSRQRSLTQSLSYDQQIQIQDELPIPLASKECPEMCFLLLTAMPVMPQLLPSLLKTKTSHLCLSRLIWLTLYSLAESLPLTPSKKQRIKLLIWGILESMLSWPTGILSNHWI